MRIRPVLILGAAVMSTLPAVAAGPLVRKPLDPSQRNAVLALMHAVDVAQETDATADTIEWDGHVLKAPNETAYLPFRLKLKSPGDLKSAVVYVRAVSRHDGFRSKDERSSLREWVERGGSGPPPLEQMIALGPGEMPIGGVGVSSRRQAIQAAAESSAALSLQQRQYEREKAAQEAAKKREENHGRDPYRFPFEDYYFADVKGRSIDRALVLPPGQYDVFVALIDRARLATSGATVIRKTIDVPDFWNDELSLSGVMFVKDVRQLRAPLAARDQADHPFTFGIADIVPAETTTFAKDDVLSVLYQLCNYGAPDVDVAAAYAFYHDVNGQRTLFNRTDSQLLSDGDLPPPVAWQTQGFVMQSVPLKSFPSGRYELEITARDRLTRATAKTTVEFTVR